MELRSSKTFVVESGLQIDLYELRDMFLRYIGMYSTYASSVTGASVNIPITDREIYDYVKKLIGLFNTDNNDFFSDLVNDLLDLGINTESGIDMSNQMLMVLMSMLSELSGAPINLSNQNTEIAIDEPRWTARVLFLSPN